MKLTDKMIQMIAVAGSLVLAGVLAIAGVLEGAAAATIITFVVAKAYHDNEMKKKDEEINNLKNHE